jgi:Right handed beta helix region
MGPRRGPRPNALLGVIWSSSLGFLLAAAAGPTPASSDDAVRSPRPPADVASPASGPPVAPPGRLIRVPEDLPTPRDAIAAAQPGDVIVLAPGTYDGGVLVPADKHDLTIRGADRNGVVFDGKGFSLNAIDVEADNVTLENLSAHDFDGNGFYWEQVAGFTGRYLTVWNVNLYGIYATESRFGTFEHDLVSGAADAAFYVGECEPCDTTVADVEGRLSAIGYSGTNTGAGLVVRNSLWDRNGTGILPNSFEGQARQPPERGSTIERNTVRDSGSVPVPAHSPLAGLIGIGIGIAGGVANSITNNTISGSDRYGIALFPTLQQSRAVFEASANEIRGNDVRGSGVADLAFASLGPGGDPNCFEANAVASSLPVDMPDRQACGTAVWIDGDPRVDEDLAIPTPDALDRLAALGPRPNYRTMPKPEAQPNDPNPTVAGLRPFRGATSDLASSIVIAAVIVGFVAGLYLGRRRWRKRSSRDGRR